MAAGVSTPLYTTEILRLAASLPLVTSLPAAHGRGDKRSVTCGSRIVAEVVLGPDGRVAELAQQVQACAFGQASAALVQGFAVGRSAEELTDARARLAGWLSGGDEEPAGFAPLAPARAKTGRHGAMLLPFDALIAAIRSARSAPLDCSRDERVHREEATPRHSREGGSPAPEPSTRSQEQEMEPRQRGDDEAVAEGSTP